MESIKTALIVIDETETVGKIAEAVSAALKGYQTLIRPAEAFAGTDLLPAHVFFLGCGKPEPETFGLVGRMLEHINLAGRPCGVFSADSKALKYLSALVKDSGAAAGEPLLVKDGAPVQSEIKKWTQDILKQKP
ncbi:MAG TPA: hypothetical protein DEQ14_11245 [Treponema sp.]|nr:hypothetical protein [Treponema sp.]